MRLRIIIAPLIAVLLIAASCSSDDGGSDSGGTSTGDTAEASAEENTGEVSVFSAMEPAEADALNGIIDELINADADYTAEVEASADFEEQSTIRIEGGNPPDVIMYPQPGAVLEQAEAGNAVSLEDLGFDIEELEGLFGEYYLSLAEFEGEHYGMPTNINLKSMIWYPVDDFEEAGYEVPETFDDLIALSDQIVEDGGTPWCVGFESGGATGWPATDWMEDLMLATAGQDVYDQWVTHEIPFDDPAVVHAGELFGEVMFTDGYVLGGADQTPAIAFGDAPAPMFEDPPGCWMHRQANFINAFFPEDAEPGVDYAAFPFPGDEQQGTLFGGEFSAVFRNAPEVKDFLDRFAGEEVQCAQGGERASSRISPNVNVGADCYVDSVLADASEVLTTALEEDTGRFDASDLMPSAVGAGSFWTGMVEYLQGGPDALEPQLADIEASWPE
jgi:alpha-glucoside transport system substrate-binding protein